jgi:hypothetical protein
MFFARRADANRLAREIEVDSVDRTGGDLLLRRAVRARRRPRDVG